ncbi:hypothetical protein EZV73_21445 [Acidaminobacter sp. JC074]|uniref:hypothetical protein n=1 Tax=Acidaminobacter sp. JC074 TaxID=2530199 RepID=UPI001F0D8A0A|nr:hypothetical protein [Acidaminobacter sp. JC074]MCH4890160.1 hypothetical protein [Acidaminobacter sp. JC074]
MQVLIVGHTNRTNKVVESLKAVEDIEASVFLVDSYINYKESKSAIVKMKDAVKKADITLFCGKLTYSWFNKNIIFSDNVGYIPKNTETFLRALMEAVYKGYDIENISVDGFTLDSVRDLYHDFGNEKKDTNIRCHESTGFEDLFLENTFNFHKNLYLNQSVKTCMTSMPDVYDMLINEKIPCVLIHSTDSLIKATFEKLKLKKLLNDKSGNDLVFIAIDNTIPDESLNYDDDYQLVQERINVANQMYLFSQLINGAIEEINLRRYVITTKFKHLAEETDQLRNIILFDMIGENTTSYLSMGIGFGDTAREARHNAHMGMRKARKKDVSSAYVVYSKDRIEGPIYRKNKPDKDKVLDESHLIAAQKTGLSVNTIFKLKAQIDKHGKNVFTVKELSSYCNLSLRSMYRVLEKLESGGYISDVGKKMKDQAGRPGRLFRIEI